MEYNLVSKNRAECYVNSTETDKFINAPEFLSIPEKGTPARLGALKLCDLFAIFARPSFIITGNLLVCLQLPLN